ncbi:hypothetical protein LTR24_010529 [Lithohypha guttulata]|uniref:RING-type domain-containing protein n=1 Tax=Lithohypha guttulata TaxID=1690604 RepID=A0ABR0JTV7_9EURO|nr:hypothetical protein LTR24_010529 [Lithohypha guttulata]
MTDDNVITIIDLDDDFDGEALDICLESTKQDVANLQESYRKCKNKVKQEIGRLRESRDKYRREYVRELAQRQKDKDSWLQKSAGQSSVIRDLKREKAVLSASNKQLRLELKAIKQRLDRMGHLICDICMEKEKCTVTKCGHGFCSDCLDEVIHYAAEEITVDVFAESPGSRLESCPTTPAQKASRSLTARDQAYLPNHRRYDRKHFQNEN